MRILMLILSLFMLSACAYKIEVNEPENGEYGFRMNETESKDFPFLSNPPKGKAKIYLFSKTPNDLVVPGYNLSLHYGEFNENKPYATKDSDLIFLGYIRKPMNATITLDRVNEKAVIFGYNDKENIIEFTPKADNIYCVEAYFKRNVAHSLFPVISVVARVAIRPDFALVDKQSCLERGEEFYENYEKKYEDYNDSTLLFKGKFIQKVQKIRKKSSDDSNDIESSDEEE